MNKISQYLFLTLSFEKTNYKGEGRSKWSPNLRLVGKFSALNALNCVYTYENVHHYITCMLYSVIKKHIPK